ncbi:MAG: hypothetical protein F6K30_23865 [Cyanothece sp. SIO2G6]|nr:hypothetical protein [Cyanothece sp. SIO2G6]
MKINLQKLPSRWSNALLALICIIGLMFSSAAPAFADSIILGFAPDGFPAQSLDIPFPNSFVTYKKLGPNGSMQRSGMATITITFGNNIQQENITIDDGVAQCRAKVENAGMNIFSFTGRSLVGRPPAGVKVYTGAGGTTPDC